MSASNDFEFPDHRKHRRFELIFPVELRLKGGKATKKIETVSRNVSIGGMLLDSATSLPLFTNVTFTIEMEGPSHVPIELKGKGKIVRIQGRDSSGFGIAVECVPPIAEMERRLCRF